MAISATNRNFKGRMCSRDAEVYLGSPAVVAASAIAGRIAALFPVQATEPKGTAKLPPSEPEAQARSQPADILSGFPASIKGRALYLPADNMNTDGIFAGKWTYQDDLTPEKMAEVLFENYDPDFHALYEPGDILIGGRNYGSGSSREQAATALIHKGIPCVIAASFSETYRRNAFNNGFLCLECPALVDHLADSLPPSSRLRTQDSSPHHPRPPAHHRLRRLDHHRWGRPIPLRPPLSTVAQELVIAGGAEPIARASLT